ncbi:MAG: hypothetical protein HQL14_01850 [Candidatus Omnitrophica bacterium]|nr:hypothetical protein [Candidatus Omnitrophota bacterium]
MIYLQLFVSFLVLLNSSLALGQIASSVQGSDSYQSLMSKAEMLEFHRDYFSAVKVYNYILKQYPNNQAAFNLKMRALMELGANSLALELSIQNPYSDPVLCQRARGNLAAMYIRWDEPQEAIAAIQLKKEKQQEDYARARDNKININLQAAGVEENRSRWDNILILKEKNRFDEIVADYQKALQEKIEIPSWIKEAAGDAYLAKWQPKKALSLYQSVLKSEPDSFNVKIAIYYTFIDLGRYQQAGELLESMDRLEPVQIKERGIMRDNPHKEEISYNKIWLLMYQDRLKKAQKIGDQYFNAAPMDTQILSAMAHLYLWRGWPRRALEEFRIIHTMDPSLLPAELGFARALYDNMHQAQGRLMLKSLSGQYPRDPQVLEAKRQMDVDDMAMWTMSGYYTHEIIGDDEFYLSNRLDERINDHNQLFFELIRRNTEFISTGGGHYLTQRFYLGDIYRPDNAWKLTEALTGDYNTGQRIGGISEVAFTPDDHWTHTFHYDSRTIDIPLVSRAPGENVQDYSLSSLLRLNESFDTGLSADLKNFQDGNANWNYQWTTDSAIRTFAYWRWRLGTEFDARTFSKQAVDYYSPKKVYDFYLIPNVEHIWYKLYEKQFSDRFYIGLGQQWEYSISDKNVGYLREEVEYKASDTLSFLVGLTYSLEYYTGQHMNVLDTYWTVRQKF